MDPSLDSIPPAPAPPHPRTSWLGLNPSMMFGPQVFEVKNDAMMNRTNLRPLPSGRITRPHAVMWASSMGLAGTALLACETNMLAAGAL
ncbi:Protoheme IX farnesyltransferase, mitochondrial [Salvia divinorum]|uniref:Heme O synthase n=1 Tax=Salvia divinorum TaxID=28513 RepID=A0ABD1FVI2_SALDI